MALTDIKNKDELIALYPDNSTGLISPADMRTFVLSTAPYGGVLIMPVGSYSAPDPKAPMNFVASSNAGNDLMTFDVPNNKIEVLASGIYNLSVRLRGDWPTNKDLKLQVYLNGLSVPNLVVESTGRGAGNPITLSVAKMPILIQDADILDGGELELYIGDSGTEPFTVNIESGQFEIDYIPMTKGAIG